MKTLYIVRHAKSSWKINDQDDLLRPLKARGYRDCQGMAERLSSRQIEPDLIVTSPAIRAYSTALILTQALRYDPAHLVIEPDLYHAPAREIMEVITKTPANIRQLMIVGHEPSFSELFRNLTGETLDKVVTSGIVSVEFDMENWKDLPNASGSVVFYLKPDRATVKES